MYDFKLVDRKDCGLLLKNCSKKEYDIFMSPNGIVFKFASCSNEELGEFIVFSMYVKNNTVHRMISVGSGESEILIENIKKILTGCCYKDLYNIILKTESVFKLSLEKNNTFSNSQQFK